MNCKNIGVYHPSTGGLFFSPWYNTHIKKFNETDSHLVWMALPCLWWAWVPWLDTHWTWTENKPDCPWLGSFKPEIIVRWQTASWHIEKTNIDSFPLECWFVNLGWSEFRMDFISFHFFPAKSIVITAPSEAGSRKLPSHIYIQSNKSGPVTSPRTIYYAAVTRSHLYRFRKTGWLVGPF